MLLRTCVFLCGLMMSAAAWAFTPFVIKDIRVEGLQRIEVGTVFNYLPLTVGETLDDRRAAEAIRALFKTGFFQDVSLGQDGDALVVRVQERPSVGGIAITGNKDIATDDLKEALKKIGLAEGRTFDRALLDQVERELERQYFARGKYGVSIKTEVKPLARNRVDISLKIDEGDVARIHQIILVGNRAFDDETLLEQFQLGTPTMLSLITQNDRYSKQKLAGDLESLRSFYLDRGYINFSIESTQVSITPDKKDVYITINIAEGERFKIKDVRLAGDLIVPESELKPLVTVNAGDVFSRREATESAARLSERLGNEGYAFASVNPVPEVDAERREVGLTFLVDPGKRVYVRRINITGNERTLDEVVRREFRQMEGATISTEKINRSRVRLQRLGYFDDVNVETPVAPGAADQVDVNVKVTERDSFGSLMAGIGFSQSQGILINASVNQDNFLGSGKRVSAAVNNSRVNTVYSFGYTNPYYTMDGVSRGFRVFLRSTDAGNASVADFTSDTYGASVNYGYPLNEFDSLRLALGYESTRIKETSETPLPYRDFLAANGDTFDGFKVTLGWSHDTRNRAIFPDDGWYQNLSSDIMLPGGGVSFYKLSSSTSWYHPFASWLTLSLGADLGYGAAYGETEGFPFFENFYAGGIRSVRGFKSNSLGPREGDNPLGGSMRATGSAELLFPAPFVADSKSFRLGAFVDFGNVYADIDDFDVGELRYSTGLSAVWLSPIGPLTFSVGKALNAKDVDETELFQFSLGAVF